MKIIQIIAAYKPAYIYGGPTMSVAKLCETLEKNKAQALNNKDAFNLEVFTTTANGKAELNVQANEKQLVDGVKVTYFNRQTKDHTHFSVGLIMALRNEILRFTKHNKTLVIHIHAWWNLVSVLSCAVAKWYNVPVILSPRGTLTKYTYNNRNSSAKKIIHHIIGKKLLKYCHIHATSEQEKEDVLNIIKPKSITVISNLVALYVEQETKHKEQKLPQQQDELATQLSTYQLIFLSRIEEKKGLELLFDALSQLKIDWKLTIAGSGEETYINELKFKTENLKLNGKINWLGHVKNQDKFKLLANHDLMVLTSYNENFANVVIESLSVGTPVLLSNWVGLTDFVIEKDLGWVSELNAKAIANQLNEAYTNRIKRAQIRQSAPQLIKEYFNDITLIKKYINLYESLANGSL